MRLLLALPLLTGLPCAAPTEPAYASQAEKPAEQTVVEPGTSRAWALLTCAVLFERNGERHDLLAGRTLDAKAVAETKKLLDDSWDIKTRDHLLEQLEWLRLEGHRDAWAKPIKTFSKYTEQDLEALIASIPDEDDKAQTRALWQNAPRILKLKGGLLGWDLARFIALCRWGYAAGFLTEEDAWKKMEPITKQLQKAYASWDDLGEAYCIGRECWKPGANEETLNAFERLEKGETSPLKSTPWDLKLGKLDKPEKRPEPKKSDPKKKP